MFDDWKKAWQEAVSNFQRELEDEDDPATPAQIGAMRRDLQAARRALDGLQLNVNQTQTELAEEEKQEQLCRRRGELAAGIGDEETVRIANQWAERHAQRATILRQKVEVLKAELSMRTDDLRTMEGQLGEAQQALGLGGAVPGSSASQTAQQQVRNPAAEGVRQKQDQVFRNLEREAKEKAAEARLEELKKKMR